MKLLQDDENPEDNEDGESEAETKRKTILYAWGSGYFGQLGNGGLEQRDTPVEVEAPKFKFVACGNNHSAALDVEGNLYVWGKMQYFNGEFDERDTVKGKYLPKPTLHKQINSKVKRIDQI
jgi:alpha-tubulin suppressor-like RCC1 family protein